MVFGGADDDVDNDENELIGILNRAKTKKKLKLVDGNMLNDVEGMSLSNPNYFFDRMDDRDPSLFLKKATGNFKSYSRSCASNMLRQPVSLTDSEKEKIDKEHPGSYSKAVKYGSSPDKQFWYICPRYWCLKTNTSITEKEVEDGVCGGKDAIIPPNAKKVPKGKSIFEFNAKAEHLDSNEEYITHYPGFMPSSKHPDNLCIPCCFKKWNEEKIKKCAPDKDDNVSIKSIEDDNQYKDMYVLGQDKFPLDASRYGYLPISIQIFLNTDNSKCASDKNPNMIKSNHSCLLRYGIEYSEKQSLLYCLADFISSSKNKVSISTIKSKIINLTTIDKFISYHNGNLIDLFKPSDIDYTKQISLYYTSGKTKSRYYSKLNYSSTKQMTVFKTIVASYEKFIEYIKDSTSLIDHTYIWDIICSPGSLFIDGMNLVILEVADDDITNNVNVYCPSNHYSNYFFDIKKNTILLIKKNNIYEPIYEYREGDKIVKYFNFTNPDILPNLKTFLLEIQNYFSNCKPLRSSPRVYQFKNNLILYDLEKELHKANGKITDYILNFNNKVVAVKAKLVNEDMVGVLPCYPSAINDHDINIVFIDDIHIWSSYTDTLAFLNKVKELNSNILSQPFAKVVEYELIVGVLTETNQFIMISEPTEFIDDDLKTIKDTNYITIDNTIMTTVEDTPRDEFVRNVQLETNFYKSFKNLVRTVINKTENRKIKTTIFNYIETNREPYHVKLEKMIEFFKKMLMDYITFSHYSKDIIDKITSITSCFDNSNCDESFCLKSGQFNCKLNIPQMNLINNLNNETIYYARISDEMLRFNRVKSFIFEPDIYLSFVKVNYDMGEDEILLMYTSIVGKGYLDNLQYDPINTYITNNTFDTIQPDPQTSQKYSDVVQSQIVKKQDLDVAEHIIQSAPQVSKEMISNEGDKSDIIVPELKICKSKYTPLDNKLNKLFPAEYKTLEYERNEKCGLQLIYDVLKINNVTVNRNDIMKHLYDMYTKYMNKYSSKIFTILKKQGKKDEIDKVEQKIITFEDYLFSETYIITELDILLLSLHYNISIIILDNMQKRGNITTINFIPNKYDESNTYYLLANYSYLNTPKYKIISNASNNKIQYNALQDFFNSRDDIKITICNEPELELKDFDLIRHYLDAGETKAAKKKLILKESK